MVSFNGDHGNIVLFELLQSFNGMNERLCIDGAFIKQVAGNNYEIDFTLEGIVGNLPERTAEVVETLAYTILFIAKVRIRDVDKRSSHGLYSNQGSRLNT